MKKVKLTSVCRPKQWKSIPISELSDVGYPVYGANGVIGYYDSYNHEQETVIITCRGATCGTVNLTHPRSYVTGNAMCLDNVKDSVDIKYLFYSMQAYDFTKVISGTAQPQITRVGLEKVEITLPSLDVQREIVSILDKIDALIEQRRLQLKKLEELVKARFVEMFGDLANPECKWNKYPLINACLNKDDIKCGPFGTQLSKDEYTAEGIAVWEIPQINMGFQCAPTHFLTEEKANQLEAYSLIPGDIAMSRKGNVGKCALFPEEYSNGIIHSDVLRIRVDKKNVNPVFMMYQLHFSKAVTRQIELVSSGAIMAGVNVTKLKQICVHIPPIELQQKFADFVAQIDKSKLLSGCRLFHSWAPEIEKSESCWRAPTEDKGFAGRSTPTMTLAGLENLNHVGAPRRKTKDLRGCRRQQ